MPTSDDLKQRLNAAASQEQSEFAMALLISEVIDAQLDTQETQQQFESLIAPLTKQDSIETQDLLDCFCRAGFGGQGLNV